MIEHRVRIGRTSEDAITVVMAELRRRGFFVVRTFDLHSAMATHVPCPCPYHGADQCDCNYSALLVYRSGESATPAGLPCVISVHQRDRATWLYLLLSPWSDEDGSRSRARLIDAMVAAVFAGESVTNESPAGIDAAYYPSDR